MTLPPRFWTIGESSIDRAGGVLRLHLLAKRCVRRSWRMSELETGEWIGVRLFVERANGSKYRTGLDPFAEWITVAPASRSVAVREDQRDTVTGDLLALEPIFRAEVVRLERETSAAEAPISELELRALHGDR